VVPAVVVQRLAARIALARRGAEQHLAMALGHMKLAQQAEDEIDRLLGELARVGSVEG
jgi:hypothetical protein